MKYLEHKNLSDIIPGRSREGAWIEICSPHKLTHLSYSRSREGAWIEMLAMQDDLVNMQVAPVRERGLKSCSSTSRKLSEYVAPVRERGLKLLLQEKKRK